MDGKMYAQFDENGICHAVGTPNITGIEATYENLGMKYEDGAWIEVEKPPVEPAPTVADVLQTLNVMKAAMAAVGLLSKEFVQPIGSHDAYKIGDKVVFNGSVYESTIDANVWSPADYPAGWKLL